jgi:hypothetical protein
MHMTIGAIVYAKNRRDAIDKAEETFTRLTDGDHAPFDYFTTGRTYEATSVDGQEYIARAFDWTRDTFTEAMAEIRKAVAAHTDDELMALAASSFRYRCHQVGMYKGNSVWLYDDDDEGIRDSAHLQAALNKWPESRHIVRDDAEAVWVVTADVHY